MNKSQQPPASSLFLLALKTILDEKVYAKRDNIKPLTLTLHVGTPKTGTTSLQVYLGKKQSKLRKLGILYPQRSHNADAPKHQWFEKNLVRTHPENLLENFKQVLSQVDENTHTLLLSSEGVYNYWWDFPEASKALLRDLSTLFTINIWVWFREPVSFSESFYKQCLRNPSIKGIPCYGKDFSLAEILDDPWFSQRLCYLDFVKQCEDVFGASSLSIFKYQNDTVQTVSQLLGLATPHDNPTPRKNASMNSVTAELYRVINRLGLSAKEKEKMVPHLHELNTQSMPYLHRYKHHLMDITSKNKIIKMTAEDMITLETRYIDV